MLLFVGEGRRKLLAFVKAAAQRPGDDDVDEPPRTCRRNTGGYKAC
jgi:hypothetical protein